MGDNGPPCVPSQYKTSSYSSGGGECVGVAAPAAGDCRVLDTKDQAGPVLTVPRAAWEVFTTAVQAGDFG